MNALQLQGWRKWAATGVVGLCGVCAMSGALADSKVYRWVDAAGNVHYGDQPPEKASAVDMKPVKSAPATAAAPAVPPTAGTAVAGAAPVDCEALRGDLDSWRNAAQVIQTDTLGNQHTLSDEEKAQAIAQGEARLAQNCTAP